MADEPQADRTALLAGLRIHGGRIERGALGVDTRYGDQVSADPFDRSANFLCTPLTNCRCDRNPHEASFVSSECWFGICVWMGSEQESRVGENQASGTGFALTYRDAFASQ